MARKQVLVQLDDELVGRLDEVAARRGVSRSELLREGARAVIQADAWAAADERLAASYRDTPEDSAFAESAWHLAAEHAPEW